MQIKLTEKSKSLGVDANPTKRKSWKRKSYILILLVGLQFALSGNASLSSKSLIEIAEGKFSHEIIFKLNINIEATTSAKLKRIN